MTDSVEQRALAFEWSEEAPAARRALDLGCGNGTGTFLEHSRVTQ